MSDASRSRTSGIDRSLQIFDTLTDANRPMSSYELSRALEAPQSTIYRLVDELVERGMLTRRNEGQIWLGPRLMRYGLSYRASIDVFAEARREMRRLCEQTGETVQICARDEGMMSVIAMAEGNGHFRVTSDVGTRVPLNWTASGRLLVGHLSEEERIKTFAAAAKPSPTGQAQMDLHILSQEAAADFKARLAVQMGQSEFTVACIASPIRDEKGACAATISIVVPDSQATARMEELVSAVQAAALRIESRIGFDHGITT